MTTTRKEDNCKQEDSMKKGANLEEVNEKIVDISSKIRSLKEKISEASCSSSVDQLSSLLELSKEVERKESDFLSRCIVEHSKLQADVNELEEILNVGSASGELDDIADYCLHVCTERLILAKKELAPKLREILLLKRQIDDVPIPAELIQYDLRFSELSTGIQQKLQRTRKLYETYNALLEIKELMLKETSLLNSISSQFQHAMTSPAGRTKLINSMEGILQGINQKLEKYQLSLESEKKVCEAIRRRYTKSLSEQRQVSSLLKAFQQQESQLNQAVYFMEECRRNDQLRAKHQCLSDPVQVIEN